MKISKLHFAILAVIFANIIWGAGAPIFKWSLHGIGPFTLSFIRFAGAAIILFPFAVKNLKIKRKHWLTLIFLAFYGFVVNITLMFVGLQFTESINQPIIGSSAPIFLIIGSFFFLKEIPKRKVLIGTLISLIGVIIVILRPILESGVDISIWGNILFVISTLGIVMYTILLKEIVDEYKPLTVTFWSFFIAGIFMLPFVVIESHGFKILQGISWQGWIGASYGAIFSSAIAYLCFNYALKFVSADEIGIFLYIDPIATILVAIPLLHEQLTFSFILGGFFVFLGIFVAEGRLNYHPFYKLRGFARGVLTVFIP